MHANVLGLLSFAAAALADPPTYTYTTLAAQRAAIVYPAYTPEQRQVVADQAAILLRDLYVHRDVKVATYGPAADPGPRADALVAEAPALADAELHARFERLFFSLHDLHTNYYYPKPQSCYGSMLPFSLAELTDAAGASVIAVRTLTTATEAIALSPGAERIQVGDRLVAIDGKDPDAAMGALVDLTGGANPAAARKFALRGLTYWSQKTHALPLADSVALDFTDAHGVAYHLDLPWVARATTACLAGKKAVAGEDEQIDFERLYHAPTRAAHDDLDPILHHRIVHNDAGTFGVLRLDNFQPVNPDFRAVAAQIKGVLTTSLSATDGLIIDLRDNGGGWIQFGEMLGQLFAATPVVPETFRARAAALNVTISRSFGYVKLAESILAAEAAGDEFSAALPVTSDQDSNGVGQAYAKPVAILTNSGCYSTCDMFTAMMQDHHAALVVSEDGYTGGGGANVEAQSYLYAAVAPDPQGLAALPGGQDMRVAWRQAIRVGAHAGELLEGPGVIADLIIPPSIADAQSDSSVQLALIGARLVGAPRR